LLLLLLPGLLDAGLHGLPALLLPALLLLLEAVRDESPLPPPALHGLVIHQVEVVILNKPLSRCQQV
jgi:hypothetical protein